MSPAVAEKTESLDLTPATLAQLIERVGGEVVGISSVADLQRMAHEGKIPDVAGTSYLLSLLEMAA